MTRSFGCRTEAAKSQWDYPAILGAYDAVAFSSEGVARPGSRLSSREVYLSNLVRVQSLPALTDPPGTRCIGRVAEPVAGRPIVEQCRTQCLLRQWDRAVHASSSKREGSFLSERRGEELR